MKIGKNIGKAFYVLRNFFGYGKDSAKPSENSKPDYSKTEADLFARKLRPIYRDAMDTYKDKTIAESESGLTNWIRISSLLASSISVATGIIFLFDYMAAILIKETVDYNNMKSIYYVPLAISTLAILAIELIKRDNSKFLAVNFFKHSKLPILNIGIMVSFMFLSVYFSVSGAEKVAIIKGGSPTLLVANVSDINKRIAETQDLIDQQKTRKWKGVLATDASALIDKYNEQIERLEKKRDRKEDIIEAKNKAISEAHNKEVGFDKSLFLYIALFIEMYIIFGIIWQYRFLFRVNVEAQVFENAPNESTQPPTNDHESYQVPQYQEPVPIGFNLEKRVDSQREMPQMPPKVPKTREIPQTTKVPKAKKKVVRRDKEANRAAVLAAYNALLSTGTKFTHQDIANYCNDSRKGKQLDRSTVSRYIRQLKKEGII